MMRSWAVRWVAVAMVVIASVVVGDVIIFSMMASHVGIMVTVAAVVMSTLVGVVFLRWQGVRGWRRWRQEVSAGRPAGIAATDGLVGVCASLLILIPGFISDIIGLLFFIPFMRLRVGAGVERLSRSLMPPAMATELFGPDRVWATRRARHRTEDSEHEPMVVEGEIIDDPSRPRE